MSELLQPKISVNKLGEYLTSSSTKKKSIIKDQIEKPKPKISAYTFAKPAIINFLVSEMADGGAAEAKSKSLKEDKSGDEKKIQKRLFNAEAIDRFLEICPSIEIQGLTPIKCKSLATEISGVRIDLNPEVLLINEVKEIKGFIKLHFSKSSNFQKKTRETIAAIIQEELETSKNIKLETKRCYMIDIGTKTISTAPKNRKKILNEVGDDCEIYSILYREHLKKYKIHK